MRSPGVNWIYRPLSFTPTQGLLSGLMHRSLLFKGVHDDLECRVMQHFHLLIKCCCTKRGCFVGQCRGQYGKSVKCACQWNVHERFHSQNDGRVISAGAHWDAVVLKFLVNDGTTVVSINKADLTSYSPQFIILFPLLSLCTIFRPRCTAALAVFSVLPTVSAASKTWRASKALAPSGLFLSSLCSPSFLSFSLHCFSSVVPPLMCKWLDDRVEGKHRLCFLGSGHAWNSSGFTAVPSDPNWLNGTLENLPAIC